MSAGKKWQLHDNKRLRNVIDGLFSNGEINWGLVAEEMNRTERACQDQWRKLSGRSRRKKPEPTFEDLLLQFETSYVALLNYIKQLHADNERLRQVEDRVLAALKGEDTNGKG